MDYPQGEKWPLKRGGRCKEVETRFSVWTFSQEKKMAVVEKWPL